MRARGDRPVRSALAPPRARARLKIDATIRDVDTRPRLFSNGGRSAWVSSPPDDGIVTSHTRHDLGSGRSARVPLAVRRRRATLDAALRSLEPLRARRELDRRAEADPRERYVRFETIRKQPLVAEKLGAKRATLDGTRWDFSRGSATRVSTRRHSNEHYFTRKREDSKFDNVRAIGENDFARCACSRIDRLLRRRGATFKGMKGVYSSIVCDFFISYFFVIIKGTLSRSFYYDVLPTFKVYASFDMN